MSGALESLQPIDPSHPNNYAADPADVQSNTSSSSAGDVLTPTSPTSMDSPPTNADQTNGSARPLPLRRHSSPLMPPFMVSAPGKVIVYGEHAVVHGKASHPLLLQPL